MLPAPGVIDYVVRHDDRSRRANGLGDPTNGVHGEDRICPGVLQRRDVRSIVDLMRREFVLKAMTRKEQHLGAAERAHLHWRRGRTPGGRRLALALEVELVERLKAGAGDDPEHRHALSPRAQMPRRLRP